MFLKCFSIFTYLQPRVSYRHVSYEKKFVYKDGMMAGKVEKTKIVENEKKLNKQRIYKIHLFRHLYISDHYNFDLTSIIL